MQTISLIAIIDEDSGLGKNNQLLCHLPADLQYFKRITLGKPIIMGRKTWESIGKPLPGRKNIVVSRKMDQESGIVIVDSLEKALKEVEQVDEVMIIGGGMLFEQALPVASRVYLTRIHHHFEADVFFPELDLTLWKLVSSEFRGKDEKNEYDMTYYVYERKEAQ